jgi:hypothetical protein
MNLRALIALPALTFLCACRSPSPNSPTADVPKSGAAPAIKVTFEYNSSQVAASAFKFKTVPAPSRTDIATRAKVTIVDGERDSNGGSVMKLRDGRGSSEGDQPAENFFFAQGTDGGLIQFDLGATNQYLLMAPGNARSAGL